MHHNNGRQYMKKAKEFQTSLIDEAIENLSWKKIPCEMGFCQGFAIKRIISEFNFLAIRIGEGLIRVSTEMQKRNGCSSDVYSFYGLDNGIQRIYAIDTGISLIMTVFEPNGGCIVFEPISVESQLSEAISGESDETKSLILKKKTYLQSHLSALLRVNGEKVSEPSVQGDDVFYWLDKSGIVYYYPIKYARLEFIGGNDEHKDSDSDT